MGLLGKGPGLLQVPGQKKKQKVLPPDGDSVHMVVLMPKGLLMPDGPRKKLPKKTVLKDL